jgi:hypothetical protein
MMYVILSDLSAVALAKAEAKNPSFDGQMLHFVQHDNTSEKMRQSSNFLNVNVSCFW